VSESELILGRFQPYNENGDATDEIYSTKSIVEEIINIIGNEFIKGTVLDVGCGNCRFRKHLLKYAETYIGLDKYLENKDSIKGDIFSFNSKINTIWFMGSFFLHYPDYEKTLNRASEILERDGSIIICDEIRRDNTEYKIPQPGYYDLNTLAETTNFKIVNTFIQENGIHFVKILKIIN